MAAEGPGGRMAGLWLARAPVRASDRRESTVPTDRELLQDFLTGHETAFAALVERYTCLVQGACRRVLGQASDVDDAFQATFLVLARKARSLLGADALAGWLYQTARRTALKARALAARRRLKEENAGRQRNAAQAERADANPSERVALRELAEILDAELERLPPRFREVLLLAQMEGLRRDEVAQRLGITVAAVKDRLERARERLQQGLRRRGVTLTASLLAGWVLPTAAATGAEVTAAAMAHAATTFAAGSATGAGAATLAASGSTVGAAAAPAVVALAQTVLQMMGWEKMKTITLCVLSLFVAGGLALGMLRDEPERFEKGLVGEIVALNNSSNPPTITVRLEEFDTLLNLDISPQAKVWTAYAPSALSEMRPGQQVSLRLADDHRTVREIHGAGDRREVVVREITSAGAIAVVDADQDEEENQQNVQPQQFQLSKEMIVRIGGMPARRDEIQPGMRVPLELATDGKTVNAIEAEDETHKVVHGEILALDTVANTLKLRVEDEDDQTNDLLLTVDSKTIVLLDGKPAKWSDLKTGWEITLRLSENFAAIRAIRANTPTPEENDNEQNNQANDDNKNDD